MARTECEDDIYLNLAKVKLAAASKNVVEFWSQKSRIKWMAKGDANSSFFHSYVKEKRFKMRVEKIKVMNGQWVEGTKEIAAEGEIFF